MKKKSVSNAENVEANEKTKSKKPESNLKNFSKKMIKSRVIIQRKSDQSKLHNLPEETNESDATYEAIDDAELHCLPCVSDASIDLIHDFKSDDLNNLINLLASFEKKPKKKTEDDSADKVKDRSKANPKKKTKSKSEDESKSGLCRLLLVPMPESFDSDVNLGHLEIRTSMDGLLLLELDKEQQKLEEKTDKEQKPDDADEAAEAETSDDHTNQADPNEESESEAENHKKTRQNHLKKIDLLRDFKVSDLKDLIKAHSNNGSVSCRFKTPGDIEFVKIIVRPIRIGEIGFYYSLKRILPSARECSYWYTSALAHFFNPDDKISRFKDYSIECTMSD